MRARLALVLLLAAPALAIPAPAAVADPCAADACGAPRCSETSVRVRPGMARTVRISCQRVQHAALLEAPPEATIDEVAADWSGVRFRVTAAAGAPRRLTARLSVTGQDATVPVEVSVEVVPLSENRAPVCTGDKATQRSPGTGPVDVFLHPWCHDPDGDEFAMEGGAPGAHPESPKFVPAGSSEANWAYRTATWSGAERSPIWATDSLGARSETAWLEVTVGPDIDRLPTCRPNPWSWTPDGVAVIHSRPGAIRRFPVICEDLDGDALEPEVVQPPQGGVFATLTADELSTGWWGLDRWMDITYVPLPLGPERDVFGVRATGARGTGPTAPMAIVSRPLPANDGIGCGWSPAQMRPGTAGTATVSCTDGDGDPLLVSIAAEPRHGLAGPPVLLPDTYGATRIEVPYVPEPGFEGTDCVVIEITDGHGSTHRIQVDLVVEDEPPPPAWPSTWPGLGSPTVTVPLPTGAPSSPDVLAAVRQVLGTRHVKRLAAPSGVTLWTPAKVSRSALQTEGRAPGLLALCAKTCSLDARTSVRPASGKAVGRRSAVLSAEPGQARLLEVALDRRARKALRRARAPRADLRLKVRAGRGKARTVKRTLRVGG